MSLLIGNESLVTESPDAPSIRELIRGHYAVVGEINERGFYIEKPREDITPNPRFPVPVPPALSPEERSFPELWANTPQLPPRSLAVIWSASPEITADEPVSEPFVATQDFRQIVYKGGAKHVYRIRANGKLDHVSHQSILEDYGYSMKESLANYRKKAEASAQPEKHQMPEEPQLATVFTELEPIAPVPTEFTDPGINVLGEAEKPTYIANALGVISLSPATNKLRRFNRSRQDRDEQSFDAAPDKNKRTSRKKILVLGATALVGVMALTEAYLQTKGIDIGNHSKVAQELTMPPTVAPNPSRLSEALPNNMHTALKVNDDSVNHVTVAKDHLTLVKYKAQYQIGKLRYSGDTVWQNIHDNLRAKLGYNPSDQLTNKFTKLALHLNHMNWNSARDMKIGQHFKLPFKIG